MKLKIIILFLIPLFSFSQLSTKVDSLYKVIYSTSQVQNNIIGMVGSTTYLDYDNLYTKLDSIATDDELLYLSSKGNNVIKYHMNAILVDRKSKHLADLFAQYIFNNEKIHIHTGCMGYESSIAGELYSNITYQKNKIDEIEVYKKFYSEEELKKNYLPFETKWTKPEVDSLLTIMNKIVLSNDNVLPNTLAHVFALNKFKFENYKRIKYFAYKYPETEILATLASFQNKKDLPLLHQNIDKAYIAISQFPDKSFIPELKERIDKGCKDYYFMDAAASFCDKDAEELLNMIVERFEALKKKDSGLWMSDSEIYDHFYSCLEKNNCSFNDEFLLKLWVNHRKMSYSFFEKIKNTHYNEILQGYINPVPFDSATFDENMDWEKYKSEWEATDGYLCPIILKYLKDNSYRNKDTSIDLDKIECKG